MIDPKLLYGNYGIFIAMGNAGFISLTVAYIRVLMIRTGFPFESCLEGGLQLQGLLHGVWCKL